MATEAVVVVVRTLCICDVSVHTTQQMHQIRVAERLGVRLPASPPPLPRPDVGVNPGRVPVYTALKRRLMSSS